MDRQLGPGLFSTYRDRTAVIFHAIGGGWPTIVSAAHDQINFVATLRPVLVFPELACAAVEREALRVAVSKAPDLRSRTWLRDKGVVSRHASVRFDAHDCPGRVR